MKSITHYSTFAMAFTLLFNGLMVFGCCIFLPEKPIFFTILGIMLLMNLLGFCYAPYAIAADSEAITMVSLLRKRRIALRDVESVELRQPAAGCVRICASGGYYGFWGLFSERGLGRYRGFYGKASDCFLVRLKNGDKYMLGCGKPAQMVEYIQSHIPSDK